MAMNVGSAGGGDEDERELNSTINTTPLVDIMLVLLIIFLITIPVINKMVPVNLPNAVNIPTQTKPENITIAVTANGNIYWNNGLVPTSQDLLNKVKEAAIRVPQPEIHIRADRNAEYESIGRVLYAIQRGGVVKVGFITEPDKNSLAKYISMQH
ncbi:MAG TPA: biopolymer transporter ExbD [Steroidobacteraceae bacterium]|nr:biopolymer transporter ExbD [Steroidobacteraceae bacterium]